MRRAPKLTFGSTIAVTLVATMMIGLMAPAASATIVIPKPFTMTVSPSTTTAGTSKQFTATFKNWWLQKMGSADLSVPAALTITGVVTSRGTYSVVGNIVKLRNLNLALLHSFTVKVTAIAACTPERGQRLVGRRQDRCRLHRFGIPVADAVEPPVRRRDGFVLAGVRRRPSAGRHGSRRDDHVRRPRSRWTPRASGCLRRGQQPQDRRLSRHDLDGDRRQPRRRHAVRHDDDVATSAGIATFADLSIDEPGDGYTLAASASGLGSTTSTRSTSPDSCRHAKRVRTAREASRMDGTGATVTALDDRIGRRAHHVAHARRDPGEIDCADYEEQSSDADVQRHELQREAHHDELRHGAGRVLRERPTTTRCASSRTRRSWTANGDTTNLGLLPECEVDYPSFVYVPPVPPCVEDRNADGSFVYLTFLAPAGDPKGRV